MLNKVRMAAAVVAKTAAAGAFGGKKTYSLEVITATDGAEYVFSVTFGSFSVTFTVISGVGASLALIATQIRSAVASDTENDGPGGLSDFLAEGGAVGALAYVQGTSPGVDFIVSTADPKLALTGPFVVTDPADEADAIAKFEPVAEAILGDVLSTTLAADQNDYDPPGLSQATYLRVDGGGGPSSYTITGIVPYHRTLYILNTGSVGLILASGSALSAPENRINMSMNRVVDSFETIQLIYDSVSSRWRIVT